MNNKTERQSNIELLRIISMVMILILHADLYANGSPSANEIISSPFSSWLRVHAECLSIVAVNVFIIISGWFGINFKYKSIWSLLYQCLFYGLLIMVIVYFYDSSRLTITHIIQQLYLAEGYWFVISYIGLIILSPILNLFAEKADHKSFSIVLISFFIFQTIYGWVMFDEAYFKYGYSLASFIGLYLLARFARRFKSRIFEMKNSLNFIIYICISIILTILYLGITLTGHQGVIEAMRYKVISYNNPLVIIESLYLFLLFNKIKIHNRIINWAATSCLSIYLIHCNPLLFNDYLSIMKYLGSFAPGLLCVCLILILIIIITISCILIDKIRLKTWNFVINKV